MDCAAQHRTGFCLHSNGTAPAQVVQSARAHSCRCCCNKLAFAAMHTVCHFSRGTSHHLTIRSQHTFWQAAAAVQPPQHPPPPRPSMYCRYITIANMPEEQTLPAYAIRASCVNINPPSKTPDLRIGSRSKRNSSSSSSSTGAAKALEGGLPCPVPSPGGKQCNGHGTCRTDESVRV